MKQKEWTEAATTEIAPSIPALDEEAASQARARQNQLTKPQGSLGQLEEMAIRLAGITGNARPCITSKAVLVMAGDHGVTEEGVSAFPSEVTPQMVLNFLAGGAAVNVLARHVDARVTVVDVGVASDIDDPRVVNRKVRKGTANFAKEPAMTREEALACLQVGREVAIGEIEAGADVIALGDMGIGNTTASSAMLAALSELRIDQIVGRGTGISGEALELKRQVIQRALALHHPDPDDPIDVLSKVGGFEIGALAGAALGAAHLRVPVVVDGLISGAAALLASRIAPEVTKFMFASHVSAEPGHRYMLELMGIQPVLYMGMRLGEGTGAALVMDIMEAACRILDEMATFDEAAVSNRD